MDPTCCLVPNCLIACTATRSFSSLSCNCSSVCSLCSKARLSSLVNSPSRYRISKSSACKESSMKIGFQLIVKVFVSFHQLRQPLQAFAFFVAHHLFVLVGQMG